MGFLESSSQEPALLHVSKDDLIGMWGGYLNGGRTACRLTPPGCGAFPFRCGVAALFHSFDASPAVAKRVTTVFARPDALRERYVRTYIPHLLYRTYTTGMR